MALYDYKCSKCGSEMEILNPVGVVRCPCGNEMERKFTNPPMVKIRGEGGYPSRRKQIRNTTSRNHPQLEHEKHRVYFGL